MLFPQLLITLSGWLAVLLLCLVVTYPFVTGEADDGQRRRTFGGASRRQWCWLLGLAAGASLVHGAGSVNLHDGRPLGSVEGVLAATAVGLLMVQIPLALRERSRPASVRPQLSRSCLATLVVICGLVFGHIAIIGYQHDAQWAAALEPRHGLPLSVIIYVAFGAVIGGMRLYFQWTSRRVAVSSRSAPWHDQAILLSAFACMGSLSLAFVLTPSLRFADFAVPPVVVGAGVVLLIGTVWLFWRAHRDLGHNWSMHVQMREGHELITGGVYARIRHPMYAALLLGALGLTAAVHNWAVGGLALLVALLFVFVRAPREERFLRSQLGEEYDSYIAKTGRILPRSQIQPGGQGE